MRASAHPRSRGENASMITTCTPAPGSSPLTRGKRRIRWRRAVRGRLIPAHAGKTIQAWLTRHASRAQPRSRGENGAGRRPRPTPSGSSPLTRGKPVRQDARHLPPRLIPAHAGKTADSCGRPPACRAHPRSRGENPGVRNDVSDRGGSSPLTRGKHRYDRGPSVCRRLIPAHAGKTYARLRE